MPFLYIRKICDILNDAHTDTSSSEQTGGFFYDLTNDYSSLVQVIVGSRRQDITRTNQIMIDFNNVYVGHHQALMYSGLYSVCDFVNRNKAILYSFHELIKCV